MNISSYRFQTPSSSSAEVFDSVPEAANQQPIHVSSLEALPRELLERIILLVGKPGTTSRICRALRDATHGAYARYLNSFKNVEILLIQDLLNGPESEDNHEKYLRMRDIYNIFMGRAVAVIPRNIFPVFSSTYPQKNFDLSSHQIKQIESFRRPIDESRLISYCRVHLRELLFHHLSDEKKILANSLFQTYGFSVMKILNPNATFDPDSLDIPPLEKEIKEEMEHLSHTFSFLREDVKEIYMERIIEEGGEFNDELELEDRFDTYLNDQIFAFVSDPDAGREGDFLPQIPLIIDIMHRMQEIRSEQIRSLEMDVLHECLAHNATIAQIESIEIKPFELIIPSFPPVRIKHDFFPGDLLYYCKNLRKISFSYLPFTFISEEITYVESLRALVIESTPIRSLPFRMGHLKNLEILVIKKTKMNAFPIQILDLSNLKFLGLDGNKIRSLPEDIDRLKKLEKLSIANTQITTLPPKMKNLPLEQLVIHANQISRKELSELKNAIPDLSIIHEDRKNNTKAAFFSD